MDINTNKIYLMKGEVYVDNSPELYSTRKA